MMKKLLRRKGSVAVLLTILFVSLMFAASVIGEASSRKASEDMLEQTFDLAGRSVLSCYDAELQERYSIFGFESDDAEIEKMLTKFTKDTISAPELLNCKLEDVSAEKTGYSLAKIENFKPQILELMKGKAVEELLTEGFGFFSEASDALKKKDTLEKDTENLSSSMEAAKKAQEEAESSEDYDGESVDFGAIEEVHGNLKGITGQCQSISAEDEDGRELNNKRITDTLPSAVAGCKHNTAFTGAGSLVSKLSVSNLSEEAINDVLVDEYAMIYFNDHSEDGDMEKSFFRNEVEYILYGEYSDKENYQKTYFSIYNMRVALNILHIYTDSTKRTATLTAAESLTPGPWGVLTQFLLITAWSNAEAVNDMKNLEADYAVPIIKKDSDWKTDLDSLLSGDFSTDGFIEGDKNGIMKYGNYLRILLMTEDQDTKYYRIMDLIQINMKGSEREDFLIADHYTGFMLNAKIKKNSISAFVRDTALSVNMLHTYKITKDE